MSLRIVHIVFIVVATLTMVGFGVWSVLEYLEHGSTTDLLLAVGSFVAAGLLIWYGNRFFRKLKDLKTMKNP